MKHVKLKPPPHPHLPSPPPGVQRGGNWFVSSGVQTGLCFVAVALKCKHHNTTKMKFHPLICKNDQTTRTPAG